MKVAVFPAPIWLGVTAIVAPATHSPAFPAWDQIATGLPRLWPFMVNATVPVGATPRLQTLNPIPTPVLFWVAVHTVPGAGPAAACTGGAG